MEPALVSRFRTLLDGCLRCGQATPERTCPSCGEHTAVPGRPRPGGGPEGPPVPVPEPLGTLVQTGPLWRRRRGVVVAAAGPDQLTLLQPDGTSGPASGSRLRTLQVPPGRERVRSPGGALLAADAGLDLAPEARTELRRQARAWAGDPSGQRALAADCAALALPDLLSRLSQVLVTLPGWLPLSALSDSEQTWWQAMALWTARRWTEAATALLGLPAGRYPQRLLLWWQAVASGSVPDPLRPELVAAARDLAAGDATGSPAGNPAVPVAAGVLLRALGERTGAAADATLVGAASALGDDSLAPWLQGLRGDSPAARLLGARSPALDREQARQRLGPDLAILDAAPPAVLDDLIDQQRIPLEWFATPALGFDGQGASSGVRARPFTDRSGELACARYIWARACVDGLDDASLVHVGAHDERARRSIAAGAGLPEDLPPEVEERFTRLQAAVAGDRDALLALAEAAELDTSALRAVLDDPAAVPDAALLADGSLARWLLHRSTMDPQALPTEGLDEQQRQFAAVRTLRQAKDLLYAWDWPAARDAARTCLRFARSEAQRDEAQNLMAAAHWQLGNDPAASAALSAALDGQYTAALQVNFAVVAGELEPEEAAAHLSKLVLDAPDLPLRVSAAMQAVRLWRSGEQWQHGEPLPADLAGALRSLVVAPVEYDVFRDLVRLLATHDDTWLAGRGALDGSPHRKTWAARVWTANARDPEEFVKELAAGVRGSSESWLGELRDQLLQDLVEQMNPPGPDTPWSYGVLVLENELPMGQEQRVVLLALTVGGLVTAVDPTTSEPATKFLTWLERAMDETAKLPADRRDPMRGVLQVPLRGLISVHVQARGHQLEQAYGLYQSIRSSLREAIARARGVPPQWISDSDLDSFPRHMYDTAAVGQAAKPGVDLCQDTQKLMTRLHRFATPDLVPAIQEVYDQCQQLIISFRRLYR